MPVSNYSQPVRILEVVDTLEAGGMEHQLVALINRLDPASFSFEVCCLRHAGVNAAKLNPGIPVHALLKSEGFQRGAVAKLRDLIRRGGYDVIHTHNLSPLIYATLAAVACTGRIFHGEHSQFTPAEFSPKRVWQRRLLYLTTAAVHTVSAGQRDELIKAGVRHRHLTAILNGVDTHRFRPASATEERSSVRAALGLDADETFWIGIVARFGAFKRHAALIEAFARLATEFPRARLLMVGDGGPEKEKVLAQVQSSAVADRIRWAGYQADPAPWYRALDLLAVPSSNEGLSNTTLEAMASAVPVLSNDICGARELITDGTGGWVRDLSTVDKLYVELRQALLLPDSELKMIGSKGREHVIDNFSWSAMARNYAAWFQACAGRAPFPKKAG